MKVPRNNDGQAVKKKLDCKINRDKQSSFHAAAAAGHSKIVKILLEKGADVTIKGPGHMRPLQVAALEGHAILCASCLGMAPL